MTKRYVALARVSSREQEREGFSLDVQEEALQRYAERQGGRIVQLYRIAETASQTQERKTFREMLAYAKQHAEELDGVLFYKVDRAARNLFDYVELERLEAEFCLSVAYVTQPTENTPAGRMQRRILANMASFYTEQQSVDVREGMARRVQSGLFVARAPYGYQNVRVEGRGLIQVHPEHGPKVRRIFDLYAYHNHTLESLVEALHTEGTFCIEAHPRFARSQLHAILRDRSYIGEVEYQGQWHPGTHQPLVDRATFDRVQVLLGDIRCQSRRSVYGSGLAVCAHCGHPVVVEVKTKKTKTGDREYVYYRCSRYNEDGHPRVRVREAELDAQVLDLFGRFRVQDEKVREWIVTVLRAQAHDTQEATVRRQEDLQRQLTEVRRQKDRLLSLRLAAEIDPQTFAQKSTELRDAEAALKLRIDAQDRGRDEKADLAVKAFELSQALTEKWVTADIAEKRQILEIICLNFSLDGATLVPTMRKPFDVLVEGLLVQTGRGDWT